MQGTELKLNIHEFVLCPNPVAVDRNFGPPQLPKRALKFNPLLGSTNLRKRRQGFVRGGFGCSAILHRRRTEDEHHATCAVPHD